MKKTYKEIEPGDIFRTEYGDYDNFVEIVFESNEIEYKNRKESWLKTIGHYKNGNEFVGYSPIYGGRVSEYDVIGRESNERKDKEEN